MTWLLKRAGGRKITGFAACLLVGGVLIYFGRLDGVAAAFLCGLYAAYVGGNAGEHIATAIGGFASARALSTPDEGANNGDD